MICRSLALVATLAIGGFLPAGARASDPHPGADDVLTDDDVIDGLGDLDSLRHAIEHVPSSVIPVGLADVAPDPALFESLAGFDLMRDVSVWRVELHPSFDLQLPSSNPVGHTVDSLTGAAHWLVPGLPGGDTLVMHSGRTSFTRPNADGGRTTTEFHDDRGVGGTYKVTKVVVYRPDGTVESRHWTARFIDDSGDVDHTITVDNTVDDNGQVVETRDYDNDDQPPRTTVLSELEDPALDPTRPTPPPTPPPNPYTQPAEDVDAGICPLIIPRCAFLFREMQRAGHSYATGWIRVNPENWSDGPEGYRLDVDPGQLVVNPDPTVAEAKESAELPPMTLDIPVWVNPPGPIHGAEAFEQYAP
ncbi:MAG: hypothetical protein KTR31_16130 [Myxococcales bacterium]|nr:hypothetical protein [Myxococcales bacterium]